MATTPHAVQAGTSHDLYWSMGDSGPQLDTTQMAQNPNELHGSIIRIALNSNMGTDYTIPNGNPYKSGGTSFGALRSLGLSSD